jgi:hypothetical protein
VPMVMQITPKRTADRVSEILTCRKKRAGSSAARRQVSMKAGKKPRCPRSANGASCAASGKTAPGGTGPQPGGGAEGGGAAHGGGGPQPGGGGGAAADGGAVVGGGGARGGGADGGAVGSGRYTSDPQLGHVWTPKTSVSKAFWQR